MTFIVFWLTLWPLSALAQDDMPLSQLATLGVLLSHYLLFLSAPVLTFPPEYGIPFRLDSSTVTL